jgi:hypothetical protein
MVCEYSPIVLVSEDDLQRLVDAVKVENANRRPNLHGVVPIDVKVVVPDEVCHYLYEYWCC